MTTRTPEADLAFIPISDMTKEKPFLEKVVVVEMYNPKYGDDRECVCSHSYYRHFDTYDNMANVGCKYCGCDRFQESGD
jgi:hypothetical protein